MAQSEVLIVGGGIGGLTAALAFARRGWRARIFERAAKFGEVGAGIQLSPNCMRVLIDLGLGDAVTAIGCELESVEMRHWRTGRVITGMPLGSVARRRWGFPYLSVHRADLLAVLLDAVRASGSVALHTGVEVRGLEQEPAGVAIDVRDNRYRGALVVGADGIHSTVRAQLFGAQQAAFTGHVAWRCLVPTALLPGGSVEMRSTAWWGPGRHCVHYPVRAGALVNCVCVVEQRGWEVESWTERGDHEDLVRDFEGWHPDVSRLVRAADPQTCYRWALFDRPRLRRWSVGRATLLGDACHPMLPFMAQGAAMAVEDAGVLARVVTTATDVPTALARYEAIREPRAAAVQAQSRRNGRIFHWTGPLAVARNLAAGLIAGRIYARLYGYDALSAAATGEQRAPVQPGS